MEIRDQGILNKINRENQLLIPPQLNKEYINKA